MPPTGGPCPLGEWPEWRRECHPSGLRWRCSFADPFCSIDNVIAAVDRERLTGDQLRSVHAKEGNRDTDVLDRYEPPGRSFLLGLGDQFIEIGDAGCRSRLERTGRDRVHSDALGSK